MKNKKYYPFERNHYFYGKLLTVRDFEDEQRYMNDKRRINNVLTKGAGVISGLSTVMIDEKTISLETGMALDYMGREIIVPESVTKKLNVLDGFKEIKNYESVYLCLEYSEKKKDKMHSITEVTSMEEVDYNRVEESYHLFLTDGFVDHRKLSLHRLKEEEQVIYDTNGIKVVQIVPKYANPNKELEIKVRIEKHNVPRMIEVDYTFSSEYIKAEDGSNQVRVYYTDEDLTAYKEVELSYIVKVIDVKDTTAKLVTNPTDSRILIGSVPYSFTADVEYKVNIMKDSIVDKILSDYTKLHFDDILNINAEAMIYLAKMRLIKKESEYYIEAFEPMPFGQFLPSNAMLYMLMQQMNRTMVEAKKTDWNEVKEELAFTREEILPLSTEKTFACGEETIEIDLHSKNKSYFSDEIVHGLGKGDVLIHVAVEDTMQEHNICDVNATVFGDISIFKKNMHFVKLPNLSTGVLSYTDKGTFRIGVKFLEDAGMTNIKVKWWAYKEAMKVEKDFAELNTISVKVEPNTIKIGPRDKYKFDAVVLGSDSQECRWSVLDKNGGQIDFNGLYEAPTQEGVYEIMAESVKYPNKKAIAYVVVKQK